MKQKLEHVKVVARSKLKMLTRKTEPSGNKITMALLD